MQELNDELMDVLGISEDDAQYAPEDPENEEDESEAIDENGETNDETQLEAEETEAGAESDDERQKLTMLRKMTPMMTVRLKRPKSLRMLLPNPPKITSEVTWPAC